MRRKLLQLSSALRIATVFLATLVAPSAADAHFYERGSDVVPLRTTKDFKARVSNSSFLWVLQLYREGCGFCKLLETEYEKAAGDLKHLVYFGAIDVERYPNLASAVQKKYGFRVEGVPTLKLLRPGALMVQDHAGERTAKALRQAATNAMPSFVEVVSAAGLDRWLTKGAPAMRKSLLISTKSSVPPLFKAVSSAYHGRIEFAQVTSDLSGAVAKRFKVAQLPTLVVLRREADDLESEKWLAEKFPDGATSATMTWAEGEKPSFRKIEGWLMGYARAPSRKGSPGKGKAGQSKAAEL